MRLWPQYGLLIQMMADAGYTVISTPFAVTFKHTDCAAAVHEVRPQRKLHTSAHAPPCQRMQTCCDAADVLRLYKVVPDWLIMCLMTDVNLPLTLTVYTDEMFGAQ